MEIKLIKKYDLATYISNIDYFYDRYCGENNLPCYQLYLNLFKIISKNLFGEFIEYVEDLLNNNYQQKSFDEDDFIDFLINASDDLIDLKKAPTF